MTRIEAIHEEVFKLLNENLRGIARRVYMRETASLVLHNKGEREMAAISADVAEVISELQKFSAVASGKGVKHASSGS